MGWKVLDIDRRQKEKPKDGEEGRRDRRTSRTRRRTSQDLPPGLVAGTAAGGARTSRAVAKQTRPPQRFTEATLLTAMETAGKTLDEKELSEAMKDSGLGTPATRAEIIETLLAREYIVRQGKTLEATDKGIRLIEVVHPDVKSPAMTGQWEAQLQRIQRGQGELGAFMRGIEEYVREVVGGPSPPGPLPSPPALPHRERGRRREQRRR